MGPDQFLAPIFFEGKSHRERVFRISVANAVRDLDEVFEVPPDRALVNRRRKLTPYRRPMLTPMLTISTWIARRWPGLQRANQVRVMGLFGFSFEIGF